MKISADCQMLYQLFILDIVLKGYTPLLSIQVKLDISISPVNMWNYDFTIVHLLLLFPNGREFRIHLNENL